MKYATLGIIGHVDHGKTSLVKALTGTDTDRLEEEKRRGISIVLGYAHLRVPCGEFGIIDAPGHEKFIRTMIAGATGSDAVLLVVDVNEGVKPQTVEHLDIAGILGIRRGVVAITKIDSADAEMSEIAAAEVRDLVQGTFLETAPVLAVSAHTGVGLDALKSALNATLEDAASLPDEGNFYLPIDRVFTMSGHGTVVTGTLRRGSLGVDDPVEIYPQRTSATVREMQSHAETVARVLPGRRTAVNLRGLERTELRAGDVIASPGSLTPARFLDVELKILPRAAKPARHNQIVRLLFGTCETYARLHLLDREEIDPGDVGFAQLKLEDEVSPLNMEPFVIRTYSPTLTIGGGRVLEANSGRTKRHDPKALERMRVFAACEPAEVVSWIFDNAGMDPVDISRVFVERRLSRSALKHAFKSIETVDLSDNLVVRRALFDQFVAKVSELLAQFHNENPTLQGITRLELSQRIGISPESPLLAKAFTSMRTSNTIGLDKGLVFLAAFNPQGAMSESDRRALEEIESAFREGGLAPPMVAEITQNDPRREKLYRLLVGSNALTPLTATSRNAHAKNNIAFHKDSMEIAKNSLRAAFGSNGFTTAQAKELLNISRKFLIPLLEHFDAVGVTKRAGEERRLRE